MRALFDALGLLIVFKDRLNREARTQIVACVSSLLKTHPEHAVALLGSLALELQVMMHARVWK